MGERAEGVADHALSVAEVVAGAAVAIAGAHTITPRVDDASDLGGRAPLALRITQDRAGIVRQGAAATLKYTN